MVAATVTAATPQAQRVARELSRAINACCDARGDDDGNRSALHSECAALSVAEKRDLAEHFDEQTAVWRKATGQSAPK